MLDKVLKSALVLLAGALVAVAMQGVPVRLVIEGPSSSAGIPLHISGVGSESGRYEIATATSGGGTVFVTRMNRSTGTIEVFEIDMHGKLVPTDKN